MKTLDDLKNCEVAHVALRALAGTHVDAALNDAALAALLTGYEVVVQHNGTMYKAIPAEVWDAVKKVEAP